MKLTTRVAMALMALFAPLLVALGTSSPAEAYYIQYKPCVSRNGVTTCAGVDWERQPDGDGVRLNAYAINTNVGCGKLEGGAPYHHRYQLINPTNGANHDTGTEFSSGSCDFQSNVVRSGPDTGYVRVQIRAKVRVNNGGDHYAYFVWDLYPSGNSVNVTNWTAAI